VRLYLQSVKGEVVLKSLSKQRGISIIEVLVFLVVISILLSQALIRVKTMLEKSDVERERDNIQQIIRGVYDAFAADNDYQLLVPGARMDSLAGIFPNHIVFSSAPLLLRNTWGGSIIVIRLFPGFQMFRITYQNVPARLCVPLINSTLIFAQRVSINGIPYKDTTVSQPLRHDQLGTNTLVDMCSVGDQQPQVISWDSY